MDLGIRGKTALITGGAGGIGSTAARVLAEEGVNITLTDRDQDGLKAITDEIGHKSEWTTAELTDTRDIERLAIHMRGRGGCDILCDCAGITGAKGDPLEMSDAEYHHVWETNFLSAVRLTRALVPQMVEKGWGRVVCVTSENAVQPYVDEAVYNTAKAALLNFIKGLAQAYAPKGVLCNTVSPAFIETPMTDGMMERRAEQMGVSKNEAIASFLKEERPFLTMGRRGRADEVAPAIALLCSDSLSFTSGSAFRVDGGSVGAMNT